MTLNYQDNFLNTIRKEKIPITIFLTSGFQIRCNLRAFDTYVLIIDVDGRQQMIFKHAVSTIAPSKTALRLSPSTDRLSEKSDNQDNPETEV